MSRKLKILLGLAVFSPAIAISYGVFIALVSALLSQILPEKTFGVAFFYLFMSFFVLWAVMMVASMTGFVICAWHSKSTDVQKLKGFQRFKWVFVFGVLWPIGVPLYWYRYIWREPQHNSATSR